MVKGKNRDEKIYSFYRHFRGYIPACHSQDVTQATDIGRLRSHTFLDVPCEVDK